MTSTLTRPGTPTVQEAEMLLRTHCYEKTLESIQRIKIVDSTEDTLTFGAGTTQMTVLTKMPDGTIRSNDPNLRLRQPAKGNYGLFTRLMNGVRNTATNNLQGNFERVSGYKMHSLPYLNEANKQLLSIIQDMSKALVATRGLGFNYNPYNTLHAILYNFLGREAVSETLRIFGKTATLTGFNLMATHGEHFRAVYSSHPNALTRWLISRDNKFPSLTEQITVERVVQDMKEVIQTEEGWEVLESLSRRFLQESVYVSDNNLKYLVNLIIEAEQSPSYTVLKTISRWGNSYGSNDCHEFLKKSIRLSPVFAKKKGRTQDELSTGIRNVIHVSSGWVPKDGLISLALSERDPFPTSIADWDKLVMDVELFARDNHKFIAQPKAKKRKKRGSSSTRALRNPRFKDVLPLLTPAVLEEIATVAATQWDQHVHITDDAIVLEGQDGDRAFLSITKDESGVQIAPEHWHNTPISSTSRWNTWGYGCAVLASAAYEVRQLNLG